MFTKGLVGIASSAGKSKRACAAERLSADRSRGPRGAATRDPPPRARRRPGPGRRRARRAGRPRRSTPAPGRVRRARASTSGSARIPPSTMTSSCTGEDAATTGTPRASASTTRHGNGGRGAGATKVTAPPNTAARSAAASAPRTCRLRSGMPAAEARSAMAGSSPSPASMTTTGRSMPACPTAASPDAKASVGASAAGEENESLGQVESATTADLVGGHGEAVGRGAGDHADPLAQSRELAEAHGHGVRRDDDGIGVLHRALEHRPVPRDHGLRPFAGRLPGTAGPRSSRRSDRCRARGRGARAGRTASASGSCPPPMPVATPSCSAAASSRRASAVRRTPASPAMSTGRSAGPAGAIPSTSQPEGAPATSPRVSSRAAVSRSGSVGATSWSSITRSVAVMPLSPRESASPSAGAAPAARAPGCRR